MRRKTVDLFKLKADNFEKEIKHVNTYGKIMKVAMDLVKKTSTFGSLSSEKSPIRSKRGDKLNFSPNFDLMDPNDSMPLYSSTRRVQKRKIVVKSNALVSSRVESPHTSDEMISNSMSIKKKKIHLVE